MNPHWPALHDRPIKIISIGGFLRPLFVAGPSCEEEYCLLPPTSGHYQFTATAGKQAPAATAGSKTATADTKALTANKTQDAAGSKAAGSPTATATKQAPAAAAGLKTATADTKAPAANKTQAAADSKAAGSQPVTDEDVPALGEQQSTVMKGTQQARAGSRAAGSWGDTSKPALTGAHCALQAEMAAKQAQIDAYEAGSEAGKLAA